MQKPPLVFALCVVTLALAACGASPTGSAAPHLATPDRVVLISVDGLRGDAMAGMPTLAALRDRGLWSDSMRTVLPALTVPGHLSMLTGRDVTTLGIVSNDLDEKYALNLVMNGASTVFDWVRGAGGTSAAVAGAAFVPADRRADAERLFGVDTLVAADPAEDSVRAQAVGIQRNGQKPTLLFVHFSGADEAGHQSGWISPGIHTATGADSLAASYVAATLRVDSAIAGVWATIAADVEAGRTAIIVTADHGGGHGDHCADTPDQPAFREHCTAASGDRMIPFVLVAKGVAHAKLPPGSRVTQVGPTVGALLGAWMPKAVDSPVVY